MSTTLRDALAARIDQVGPAHPDLDELIGLGERRLRRRRIAVVVASGAAAILVIALAIGGAAMINSAKHDNGPVDHPVHPTTKPVRPLVYSDDPFSNHCDTARPPFFCVGTLHVGDRTVRIDQALWMDRGWPMYVTDAGVVYPNSDGRPGGAWSSVWFTDGGAPRQIAQQVCSGVTTGSVGGLAVWVDCTAQARGDLVVFDTDAGREVARLPIPGCRAAETNSAGGRYVVHGCAAGVVGTEHVYFAKAGLDQNRDIRVLRLDLVTGDVVPATHQMWASDLRSDPRALVVGDSWRTGARETGMDFDVVGSRLVPAAFDSASNETVPTQAQVFDAATGRPVQLRLPAGYHPGPPPLYPGDAASSVRQFSLFEWLDDDTVALAQVGDNNHMGDIITCGLSDGACHLIAKAPPSPSEARLVVGQSLP